MPQSTLGPKLLFRCEEDRRLRAVLVGMLREGKRQIPQVAISFVCDSQHSHDRNLSGR